MILSYNHWNVRLYNSCFLAGYLCECITKELCVVKADVGDDRKDGGYDVGTIESSSKSNFDNSNIYSMSAKYLNAMAVVSSKKDGWRGSKNERSSSTKRTT